MSHQRKLIRSELVRRLIAANTSAGSRVFENRSQPLFDQTFPLVVVYVQSDRAEKKDENPLRFERTLDIAIELIAMGNDDPDDALDALALQVEDVIGDCIFDYLKQGGNGDKLVTSFSLSDTNLRPLKDGENYFMSAAISVSATYNDYLPRDKTSTFDDLETVGINYDLDGEQLAADQAEDLLTGLEL